MIHIFNRKELITTVSDQQLYHIQTALCGAGIPFHAKSSLPLLSAGRYRGTPFIDQDAANPMVIYVRKCDYDRAKMAIEAALRP